MIYVGKCILCDEELFSTNDGDAENWEEIKIPPKENKNTFFRHTDLKDCVYFLKQELDSLKDKVIRVTNPDDYY